MLQVIDQSEVGHPRRNAATVREGVCFESLVRSHAVDGQTRSNCLSVDINE